LGSKPHRWALCRWVLPFVVGLYPLSLGSAFRRWVLPLVVGFCLPSLGSSPRRWALPSAVGLYPSSLGLVVAFATPAWWSVVVVVWCYRRRTFLIVVEPSSWWCKWLIGAVSSVLGAMCHRWALHLAVGRWVVDTRGCWAVPVVDGGYAWKEERK